MTSAGKPKKSTLERVRYVRRKLGPYGRPHRKWLVQGSLAALMVVVVRLALPWPLRGGMELVLKEGPESQGVLSLIPSVGDPIWWLSGAFVVLALLQGFGEYVQRVAFSRYAVGAVHDARAAKMKSLVKKADRANGSHKTGDLIARVIGDSARLKAGLKGVLVHVTHNGIYVIGVAVMLLIIDPTLGAVFATGIVMAFLVAFAGAVRVSRVALRYRKKEGAIAETVHRALTKKKKASKYRKQALSSRALGLKEANRKSGSKDVQVSRRQAEAAWAIHGVMSVVSVVVLAMGVAGVRDGSFRAAELFTVIAYLLQAHNPMVRLGRQMTRLGKVLASAERLAAVKAPKTVKAAKTPSTKAPKAVAT